MAMHITLIFVIPFLAVVFAKSFNPLGLDNVVAKLRDKNFQRTQFAESVQRDDAANLEEIASQQVPRLDEIVEKQRGKITQREGNDFGGAVAFTAYALDDSSYSVDGATVTFGGILSNYGGHYNIRNSRFTCPVSGIYMFFLNIHSARGESMSAGIVKEGDYIVRAIADDVDEGKDALHFSHAAASAVINCRAKEQVWVQHYTSLEHKLDGGDYKLSTFSGLLVHPGNY